MIEIRGHARGGQGMVTGFEIMANVFNKLGDFHVQAFPAFGVERTGAPIQAFLRVAKGTILNRSNIYHPHLIIIFDEGLLEQVPVFKGLKKQGAVLINTDKKPESFSGLANRIYTVQATRISINLGLGTKSLPIVNAAMIGAIMRIFSADLNTTQSLVKHYVPVKPEANAEAVKMAYNTVLGIDHQNKYLENTLHSTSSVEAAIEFDDLFSELDIYEPDDFQAPYWATPMTKNKTGSWRLMTPSYVNRMPPCNANCPAGTDVREFIRLTSEEKFKEAFDVLNRHNPFPGVCGRVCPHFCEQTCNRVNLDEGLNVGAIERFLGDKFKDRELDIQPVLHDQRVAVIGSGPAGLTAAIGLRRKGYTVTVFEALPLAGGMMRAGIPKFRLPDRVLDAEIESIEKQGVEIRRNTKVSLKEIEDMGFDAIVAAVGSHIGYILGLEQEENILDGITFLREFKLTGKTNGLKRGDQIAVIGGGNTAIDVARTAMRLGVIPTIYYRRTIAEMPAIAKEVEEAMVEGVKIEFLTAPVALKRASQDQFRLTIQYMKLGEPDDSGRRRPLPVPGSERDVTVCHVIAAIGQKFDDYAFNGQKVKPVQGRIESQEDIPVFCAGDMAWGGTVTEAIGSGNKVAAEIEAYFKELPYRHEDHVPEVVLPEDINFAYYLPSPRHKEPVHLKEDLYNDFTEVAGDLNVKEIVAESARCLHCGECYNCGNCFNYCPDGAIKIDDNGRIRIDYAYCKGCGICVHECPCSAIDFQLIEEEETA